MAQDSLFWETQTGSFGPYQMEDIHWFFDEFAQTAPADQGVAARIYDELRVYDNSVANELQVMAGMAICDGKVYWQEDEETVFVSSISGGNSAGYIILETDWAAQTVRLTSITSPDSLTLPTLTQTSETLWQIPLASFVIDEDGAFSEMLDLRAFALMPNAGMVKLRSLSFADNAIEVDGNTVKISGIQSNLDYLFIVTRLDVASDAEFSPLDSSNPAHSNINIIYETGGGTVATAEPSSGGDFPLQVGAGFNTGFFEIFNVGEGASSNYIIHSLGALAPATLGAESGSFSGDPSYKIEEEWGWLYAVDSALDYIQVYDSSGRLTASNRIDVYGIM